MATASATLTSLLFLLGIATATLDWYKCSSEEGVTYKVNSTFETNLHLLLKHLSTSTNLTGFSNASFGMDPGHVEGLALCHGDVNSTDCQDCVTKAVNTIPNICPYSKAVKIWFMNCHVTYSNLRFLSVMDSTVDNILYNGNNIDASELYRFNQSVMTLLDALAEHAVRNSTTPPLFATGEIGYDSSEYPNLYGLVQCTRDISAEECYQCFQDIFGSFLNSSYTNSIGKRFFARSCKFGSESVGPFSNSSGLLSYIPPLPGPGRKKKLSSKNRFVIVAVVVVATILMLAIIYLCLQRRKSKEIKNCNSGQIPVVGNKMRAILKTNEIWSCSRLWTLIQVVSPSLNMRMLPNNRSTTL